MIAECSQDLTRRTGQAERMPNPDRLSRPPASDSATLTPDRAFVVEFAGAPHGDRLSGRIEHVVSGRAARFASAGELLEFVQGVLHARRPARRRRIVGRSR